MGSKGSRVLKREIVARDSLAWCLDFGLAVETHFTYDELQELIFCLHRELKLKGSWRLAKRREGIDKR